MGLIIIGETGLESSILTSSTSTVLKQSVRYVLLKPISTLFPSIAAGILSLAAPREVALETLIVLSSKTQRIGLLILLVIRSEVLSTLSRISLRLTLALVELSAGIAFL